MRKIIKKKKWDRRYYYHRQKLFQWKIRHETLEEETQKVKFVLRELKNFGLIPTKNYNREKFLHYRKLVHEHFYVIWTAINPPMEHLLFALSEIIQPKNILGIGIFTGNPVAWSLGPAIESTYEVEKMAAVEINKEHAEYCDQNFKKITNKNPDQAFQDKKVKIHARNGFDVINDYKDESIDLLYLDANGFDPETQKNSKNINTTLLKRAYPKLKKGAYAMCHNVYQPSFKKKAKAYLEFTDNPVFFEKTATCAIDEMGLEISKKNKKEGRGKMGKD